MLTRLTFDIQVKRPGRTHDFQKGDVVNLDRWPEIEKAITKKSKRQVSPSNKMVTDIEEK